MALIKCPECSSDISDMAKNCPRCGFPIESITKSIEEPNNISADENSVVDAEGSDITKEEKKTKNKFITGPWLGIISLLIAIFDFFWDIYPVTFLLILIALGLAIFSLVKKCKLKGFAIAGSALTGISIIFILLVPVMIASKTKNAPNDYNVSENGFSYTIPKEFGELKIENSYDVPFYQYCPSEYVCFEVIYYPVGHYLSDDEVTEVMDTFDANYFLKAVDYKKIKGQDRRNTEIDGCRAIQGGYSYVKINNKDFSTKYTIIYNANKQSFMVICLVEEDVTYNFHPRKYSKLYDRVIESIRADNSAPINFTSSTNTPLSASFKSTMDEFEDFVDEYVAFMKRYESSDDVLGMIGDYYSMIEEYALFCEKLESIDIDSLSASDYAYYLEVISRCETKLLAVN